MENNTKVVTGKVRLSYAHVWEMTSFEGQEPKYSASLIIPKSDTKTVAAIKKAIEAAKASGAGKWGGKIPPNLKSPLRDGDTDRPEDENYQGCYFINASSKRRPGIVDRNKQEIIDRDEVYSGCYVLADINFYPFNVSGNKGVAVGLNNLLKVSDGESLDGYVAAEQAFADIDLGDDDDSMLL